MNTNEVWILTAGPYRVFIFSRKHQTDATKPFALEIDRELGGPAARTLDVKEDYETPLKALDAAVAFVKEKYNGGKWNGGWWNEHHDEEESK